MFRFIKMWLLLRILAYQEEYIISAQDEYVEDYKKGRILYCSQKGFVLDCTNFNLIRAFLPKKFREPLKPKREADEKIDANKKKIRELDSLIELAKENKYLDFPKENFAPIGIVTKEPIKMDAPAIRLSHNGDQFTTYAGGLEALVTSFPKLWSIVGLSLIPWLIINYHLLKSVVAYCLHLF